VNTLLFKRLYIVAPASDINILETSLKSIPIEIPNKYIPNILGLAFNLDKVNSFALSVDKLNNADNVKAASRSFVTKDRASKTS
jgi:hypothetical protein